MAIKVKLFTLRDMNLDTEPVRNMLATILECFIGFNDGYAEVSWVLFDLLTTKEWIHAVFF